MTTAWMRNAADERAVAHGCRFDVLRGAYTVWWIERYCRLYEGEWAGQPLVLHGCRDCSTAWPIPDAWDAAAERAAMERAEAYAACVAAGHFCDWQYDVFMRLFGWAKHSDHWAREVRRFRKASVWCAKKSKKSPSLAALALYLLCGDGEQGNHVYLGAKDGMQAREIAGKHTVEMVKASAELTGECGVNLNLMRVTHWATRSTLQPLSSSNQRTQKSKEGLNGSILIDETHVVDRDFIRRVSRAGISRSEPIHAEFSTAGNDPESYGKERYDHGTAVNAGNAVEEDLLFVDYSAPQDLSDEDLAADPEKYARMANPALGHTVNIEELLSDYESSRRSVRLLADFKMYRLDIWQRSAAPWLNPIEWDACRRDFTEADMEGLPCCAGLDLARKSDMSAFVLVFRNDDVFHQLAYFWLPRAKAEEWNNLASYLDWSRGGHLKLTDGDVADFNVIEQDIIEKCRRFKPEKICYDEKYAEEITQRIETETGVERLAFPQTMMNYARPSADYDRLLAEQKLLHNGNPVLTWQAGNATVKSDNNQNIRPVKPDPSSFKSVDGIQAGIMGLSEMTKAEVGSIYEEPGAMRW
jgi:phage terminase large subunit-like protein